MALAVQTSTHPVEWEDEAASTQDEAGTAGSDYAGGYCGDGEVGGGGGGPPLGRPPSLRQAASFLRSSFNASARFLGRMGSTNDTFAGSGSGGGGGPPPVPNSARAPRESLLGSLLNAVGLGGHGHGQGHGKDGARDVSPSGGSRSGGGGGGGTVRSKLVSSQSRTLARLSSAAMLRGEIQQYGQFGDLRNDSFSRPAASKLRRRSSVTRGEEGTEAAAAEAVAGGAGTGLFRKLGSVNFLRHSSPAPYSPTARVSAPGSVAAGDGYGYGTAYPRDVTPAMAAGTHYHHHPSTSAGVNGDRSSRPGSPLTLRAARASEGCPPYLGSPDIPLGCYTNPPRPPHLHPYPPSQLRPSTGGGVSPSPSRPCTRGGSPIPSHPDNCGPYYYSHDPHGQGPPMLPSPSPGLSRTGSIALRERPPTPRGRSVSMSGSPGKLSKVLGSFRLPDILAATGSGKSITERRSSVSGGGVGTSFTRPVEGSTTRGRRVSSSGPSGVVIGGSFLAGAGSGAAAVMGPGGAAICASAAKRAAALACGGGTGSIGCSGGGSGGGSAGGSQLGVAPSGGSAIGLLRPSAMSVTARVNSTSGKGPGLLGGILQGFQSSLELDEEGAMAAVEAEFDRRFGGRGMPTATASFDTVSPNLGGGGYQPRSLSQSPSPHPPLPQMTGTGGSERGSPQPFVRRRSTLGEGAGGGFVGGSGGGFGGGFGGGGGGGVGTPMPSMLNPAGRANSSAAEPIFGGGGGDFETVLMRSYDGPVGSLGGGGGGGGGLSSCTSPTPPTLNARMRLASIRLSYAEGIVMGGGNTPRGGRSSFDDSAAAGGVPGTVASPSVSGGGIAQSFKAGTSSQQQQQQQHTVQLLQLPTVRPPSGSNVRRYSSSGGV